MTAAARAAAIAALVLTLDCAAAESIERAPDSAAASAYRARVITIIGDSWSQSVHRRATRLFPGTVHVQFDITASGKPRDVRVHAQRPDKAAADLLRDVLRRTSFPPIPPTVLRDLPDRRIAVDLNFTLHQPTR